MSGKKKQLGATAAAVSAILYGVVPIIVAVAYENGFHFATALTFQCLFSLPLLLLLFRLSGKSGEEKLRLAPGEGRKVLTAALVGMVLATVLLYASYSYISAGIATTIHFIYPILVNVGCLFVFRERLTKWKLFSLLLSGVGMVLMVGDAAHISLPGILLAAASGVAYAFYMIYIPYAKLDGMNPFKLSFYVDAAMAVTAALLSAKLGWGLEGTTPGGWICILVLSLIDSVLAIVFLQEGIKLAGSSVTALFCTLEPLTSVLLDVALVGSTFTGRIAVSCACILTGVVCTSISTFRLGKGQG